MTDKEKYRIICCKELTIPLYLRDWWLDCECGKNDWDVLIYYQEDEIEAVFPIYFPCKKVIWMPYHTQTMGIWFNPKFETTKYSKNLLRKQKICEYFIEHLPAFDFFQQIFHYSFTDWLPFYWKGFEQITRYNYILPNIKNTDELWSKLSKNIKRNIKKAKNKYQLEVRKNITINSFIEIYDKTFKRQGEKTYHSKKLGKLINTCCAINKGNIWGAFDKEGRLHAAVFIVWQENCAYYVAGGGDPLLRQSGGHALAMWNAICDLSEISSSFDFSGTMINGVERFFREFGAVQMPCLLISKGKFSLAKRVIIKIKDLSKK
ncbi:MAG: GNAT family N-acetyltransferase [Bacteroidales bacterium]|jgi:hypothetical protein|nr:GNAT family N-acetyltransferase [Bacteroidales bacterium]